MNRWNSIAQTEQDQCAKNWFKEQTHNRKSQPKRRQKQPEDADRTERKRTKKGKTNQRGETHNPNAYAHADHNRKIKPEPQLDPQSEKNKTSRWNQALFWLRFELLESSSSWTESSFEINVLLESSAEAQPKRREMNQIDAGRTEDKANQKGGKKKPDFMWLDQWW